MQAGRLKDRVKLQQLQSSKDSAGGPVETYVDVAEIWAEVLDLGGKSIMEAKAVGSNVTRRVAIRPRKDIDSSWRVMFADGTVAKLAFRPLLVKQDEMHLQCEMIDG